MTNQDFDLAELLETMQHLDRLDEPVIRVDDPPPTEHIPLEPENLEDDPIIRVDDPVDPQPGQDIPIEPETLEDDPIIRIDDPVDPQPAEDIPIEPEWYPCDEAEAPVAEATVEPEPVEEEYDPAVTCY
ncbi:MAG: hypothetical protein ACRDSK_02110 [Actinophytocola sp.]|uniref:hypothetical protein n=1 Tax=Actinophytocola sp. TaxID=1872138 RepID=UPI003D6BC098